MPTFTVTFWGEGSPMDYRKKWVPTYSHLSNLEDLVGLENLVVL